MAYSIDADDYCCHIMHSSIRSTVYNLGSCNCGLIALKKPIFWHADVSKWLSRSLSTLVGIIVPLSGRPFTTFSGFCAFVDKSLGRNNMNIGMLKYPDDFPSVDIDADGYCHFMHSFNRLTIHVVEFTYCRQIAWKIWLIFLACWCIQMTCLQFIDAYGYCCPLFIRPAIWVLFWGGRVVGCCHHWEMRGISVAVTGNTL